MTFTLNKNLPNRVVLIVIHFFSSSQGWAILQHISGMDTYRVKLLVSLVSLPPNADILCEEPEALQNFTPNCGLFLTLMNWLCQFNPVNDRERQKP